MNIEFIDLKRQQTVIKTEIDRAIQSVLENGNYIMGEHCKELEYRLGEYVGVEFCLSCANGTDALRLALVALDIKAGDVVLTTNFTFFATAEVIAELGAIPLFVDIDETYNICPKDLEEKIKNGLKRGYVIKGIISVDLFGLPADHRSINYLANKYNLWHIEDGAQGFGGKIDNQRNCSFGDISTTSFFPAKPLGCYGDGGAIFTNNPKLMKKIESLRVHGKGLHKYENVVVGYNSRLDTIQAAILLEKIKLFDEEINVKNELAKLYTSSFEGLNRLVTPVIPEGFMSSWAQYSMVVEDRDDFANKLKEKGIPTAIYYPKTMSQTVALSKYSDYQLGSLENSEKLCAKIISLPMHAYLSEEEKNYIIENVKTAINS